MTGRNLSASIRARLLNKAKTERQEMEPYGMLGGRPTAIGGDRETPRFEGDGKTEWSNRVVWMGSSLALGYIIQKAVA